MRVEDTGHTVIQVRSSGKGRVGIGWSSGKGLNTTRIKRTAITTKNKKYQNKNLNHHEGITGVEIVNGCKGLPWRCGQEDERKNTGVRK